MNLPLKMKCRFLMLSHQEYYSLSNHQNQNSAYGKHIEISFEKSLP